jgi:preprotein translocase subunit SecE
VSINRQQRRSKGRGEPVVDDVDEKADDADLEEAALADERSPDTTAVPKRGSSSSSTTAAPAAVTSARRATPRQFLHEVNVEMRKVVWPSRAETVNYASVVFVTLAVLMALIFLLDLAFTKAAGYIFT